MKTLFYLAIIFVLCSAQERRLAAVFTPQPVEIDGLKDPIWDKSQSHSGFTQLDPNPLEPATKKTEFRFLYDNENVYFFIRSYDKPENIVTETSKRDNAFNGDWILISLSPLKDNNTGFCFLVNPSNIQGDARIYNDGWEDWDWNAIWESETKIDNQGWTAEFKIPLRALKFQNKEIQDWGINVARYMRLTSEKVFWEKVDPDYGYKVSRFATIQGLKNLKLKNEIQLVPSIVSNFDSDSDYDPTLSNRIVGMDIRYNLNERNSLFATIKPDFAQIEADQDVINLSDYPLFLQEKRPFFLEGNDLYRLPDEVYYSRRMTRPTAGVKLFGSTSKLKYGLTYVNNEGLEDRNEHFLLPRVIYQEGTEFQGGYFGGFVDSKSENSGQLHVIDMTYRPNDQIRIVGMVGSTFIEGVDRGNSSIRFQSEYNTDDYYGYFRVQGKTPYFQQGLVGFPEPNNTIENNVTIGRRWRLKDGSLQRVQLYSNFNYTSNYDGSIPRRNINVNMSFRHQYPKMGYLGYGWGINSNSGQFRYYTDDIPTPHADNYGSFIGRDNQGLGGWVWFETDFSKTWAVSINPWMEGYRGWSEQGLSLTLQYRPNSDLKIRPNVRWSKISDSKFFDDAEGEYMSVSLRTEYTVMKDMYVKLYSQFNPQVDRISNNVILTYEYIRGSFMYLAYNEIGTLDEDYSKGSLIENYNLARRTVSFKITYTLFQGF